MAEFKTNVMRILDKSKIKYTVHAFNCGDTVPSGTEAAKLLGKKPDEVYKTLVTRGATKQYYVFVIPVETHLDLKKAAKSVGEKSIEMIKQSELLPLTGYVHGGCSPIGMKKRFKTVFQKEVELLSTVTLSAGKIGYQIELEPQSLLSFVGADTADVIS